MLRWLDLGFKISAEHFIHMNYMKHDVSCSEIERAGIKLEGLKSVMPINVNGSDIMLSRIFQVLLFLALLWIERLNDLICSTRMTKTESCYFHLASYLFFCLCHWTFEGAQDSFPTNSTREDVFHHARKKTWHSVYSGREETPALQ